MSGDNVCTVNIGGKKRELVFGTRAICFIVDVTGKSFSDAAQHGGITFLVLGVAAGLSHLAEFRKKFRVREGEFDFGLIEEWFDAMPKADMPVDADAPDTLKSLGLAVAHAMRSGMPGVKFAALPRGDDQPVPTNPPSP
jgi:hypothetical protein